MPLAPQSRLGLYEIISSLGAGGMGEVYRARDTRLGREVAIKVLPPEVTNEAGRLERFDREARAIAALNHPHIVTIYSTEEADGIRFLTMELVEGLTLAASIVSGGLPIAKFLEIAIPLADALTAAHQKQITHRDLKPGNVMISHDGRVKVLDFGLARVGGEDVAAHSLIATQAPLTLRGVIVGTMPYMSPEQVEGQVLDPRSDLFSLGVIFYELLSGERPFKGGSSPALMSAILRDTPATVCEKRSDLPEGIGRLVGRMLEKRPEDRVQTARDVHNELRHIQKQCDSGSRAPNVSVSARVDESLWIAVLPFAVRGADADAEAMAAGLTDDITAGLSKFQGLSVVAAQSTRGYKDSALDVRQIAERIGARYVIGGHVRKSGAAIRTTAQLIDAHTGAQLWSETYDRSLTTLDPFVVQDDLTDHIVATVADKWGVLARSMVQAVRGVTLGSATPRQLVLRCWGFEVQPTLEEHAELRAAIEEQLAQHPDDASLWAQVALLYLSEHRFWFNPLPDPLGRAMRAARRAIELDIGHQEGWHALAAACLHRFDEPGLLEAAEHAIRVNPRNSNTMAWVGLFLSFKGEYDRGCLLTERAMALNPAHPGWYHFVPVIRHFARREFAAALAAVNRVNTPDLFWTQFALASVAGQLGLGSEGRSAYDAMVRLAPFMNDPDYRREFVTRWYWPEDLIESLLDGAERSRSADASGATAAERRSICSTVTPSAVSLAPSIAVLPFTDLSEKKDQDWFCDGVAEEILNALSPLPGLRVAARASAFSLRGKADDLRAIGEKLAVTTVLTGSVRRSGDRVRITAQLSDAQHGQQLWSERFDRELKDIFDVQDEIARAIVERLKVTFDSTARLVPTATASVEAYELLLKGRVLLMRRGLAIVSAQPYFEQAIAIDPGLAEAHAMLGDTHRLMALYGLRPAAEVMPLARASAQRALAIDPNQVEALATLANISSIYDWDLEATAELSARALACAPSHVRTLAERAISYAVIKAPTDELRTAVLADIWKARALDPLNAWVMAIEAFCLAYLESPAAGVAAARRAVATDEGNFTARWALVSALAMSGRNDEAREAAVPALAMSGRHPRMLSELARIHVEHGEHEAAEAIHVELSSRSRTAFVGYGERAIAAAWAGHLDEARRLLALAIAGREPYLTFWRLPVWRAIREDAECAALLRDTTLLPPGS